MPNIPVQVHGIMDYLLGTVLIASPAFISYPDNPMESFGIIFGATLLLYSTMTDYPAALLRFIPFPFHRGADLLLGAGIAFAPIHFAVHGAPAVLFIVAGTCLIFLAFLTRGNFSATGTDQPTVPGA